LGIAQSQRPDLVIYVSDGDQDGGVAEEAKNRLRASGPTLFLDVGSDRAGRFDEFVDVTGGSIEPVADRAAVLDRVAERLQTFTVAAYRLAAHASSPEPSRRTLSVDVRDTSGVIASSSTEYSVPEAADRVLPESICSLRMVLTMKRQGIRDMTVARIIAGRDPYLEERVTDADIDAVRNAMWGTHLIHVEGGGLPLTIRADELIESQFGLDPLFAAIRGELPVVETLERFRPAPPTELFGLMGVVADPEDRALVFEEGLRMIRHSVVQQIGTDIVERRLDILPTALFHAASDDRREAFEATMRATAVFAHLEAATFPRSTATVLEGLELLLTDEPSRLGIDYGYEYGRWRRLLNSNRVGSPVRIAPIGGGEYACWSVSMESGEVIGLLDGNGGADLVEYIKERTAWFDLVIDYYVVLFGALGVINSVNGFQWAVITEYSKTLVKLYAVASFIMINMTSEKVEGVLLDLVLSLVCNIARSVFLGKLFPEGNPSKGLYDSIIGLLSILFNVTDSPLILGARCP
jgi:hypothetical protein